jgi:hypothetical protein
MLVFLDGSNRTNQRSLEPGEKPVLGAGGIQATQIVFAMQNVYVVAHESSPR